MSKCQNCKFWKRDETFGDRVLTEGICKFYPPTTNSFRIGEDWKDEIETVQSQPKTNENDFCGQFKENIKI